VLRGLAWGASRGSLRGFEGLLKGFQGFAWRASRACLKGFEGWLEGLRGLAWRSSRAALLGFKAWLEGLGELARIQAGWDACHGAVFSFFLPILHTWMPSNYQCILFLWTKIHTCPLCVMVQRAGSVKWRLDDFFLAIGSTGGHMTYVNKIVQLQP
jgi:hypothetical protein